VTYVNDSKATTVDSVWYALQSFQQPIVLFLGGRDKGNDYAQLVDLVRQHVKAIVALGESADKVVAAFALLVPVKKATRMDEAVQIASSLAAPGDVVLLSPAKTMNTVAVCSKSWCPHYDKACDAYAEKSY
jgi:UDP-N-acetylmuramoylalanine--D-glutamate ligase